MSREIEEEKDCPVCCETFDQYEHASISCSKCGLDCCKACYKRQFLIWNNPRCIFEDCKHPFEHDFLISKFPKQWVDKTLKDHRKSVLIDIEKAHLPAASEEIARRRQVAKLKSQVDENIKIIKYIRSYFREEQRKEEVKYKDEHNRMYREVFNSHFKTEEEQKSQKTWQQLDVIREETGNILKVTFVSKLASPDEWLEQKGYTVTMTLKKWKKEADDIYAKNIELWEQIHQLDSGVKNEPGKTEIFNFRCPVGECKGYLDKECVCNICTAVCCKKCMVALDEKEKDKKKHECKQEDLDSIAYIKKDTKPCPSCSSRISKLSGCFAKDTPILMFDGTSKMSQDIKEGDILVGDDGQPRVVIRLLRGKDMMYRIDQANGVSYTVNSKHTLVFSSSHHNKILSVGISFFVHWFDLNLEIFRKKKFSSLTDAEQFKTSLKIDDKIEMTVDKYEKLDKKIQRLLLGFKTDGINWPEQDLKIDPYLFGVWIGDGINTGQDISAADNELIEYLLQWCDENNAELVHQAPYRFGIRRAGKNWDRTAIGKGSCESCPVCPTQRCELCDVPRPTVSSKRLSHNPLRKPLEDYGCIQNKHIPLDFIVNNKENRLKLLAGLIDTDGFVSNEGKRATISQTNKAVVDQIELLARSLGFVVNIKRQERKQIKVFKSEPKDYKDIYIINISGSNFSEVPTKINRKKTADSNYNKSYKRTQISVTPLATDNFFGWEIDGNHRFVLPDLTCVKNCDQMFCTSCNIAFSWISGEIDNGVVHNPHYYQWLAKNGRVDDRQNRVLRPQAGNQCMTAYDMIQRVKTKIRKLNEYLSLMTSVKKLGGSQQKSAEFTENWISVEKTVSDVITNLIEVDRLYTHLNEVTARLYPSEQPNSLLELRIKYIKNEMSETQWKIQIFKILKRVEFNQHVRNLITMFGEVCSNLARDLYEIDFEELERLDPIESASQLEKKVKSVAEGMRTLLEYWETNTLAICNRYEYKEKDNLNFRKFAMASLMNFMKWENVPVKKHRKTKKQKSKKLIIIYSESESDTE